MRYLYQETTEKENQEIKRALLTDCELQKSYQELMQLRKDMEAGLMQPAASTVLNIISYARSVQEKRTV